MKIISIFTLWLHIKIATVHVAHLSELFTRHTFHLKYALLLHLIHAHNVPQKRFAFCVLGTRVPCIVSIICGPHLVLVRVVLSLCQIDFPCWLSHNSPSSVVVVVVAHCGGRFFFTIRPMLLLIFFLLLILAFFLSCGKAKGKAFFVRYFLFAFLIALCSEITGWQRGRRPKLISFASAADRMQAKSESRAWLWPMDSIVRPVKSSNFAFNLVRGEW